MLAQRYPAETLASILIPRSEWHPFPTIDERAAWDALPAPLRETTLARAEEGLGSDGPALPATLFLQFARDGNRQGYEAPHFARRTRLESLALAECIEDRGRFLDGIVDGIWALCEESFWGVPAHIGMQRAGRGLPDPDETVVDLFAAETAALLAWISYLLGGRLDAVSTQVRRRIAREVERRMLAPCRERDDFGWMGTDGRRVNNWNPWIVSNWLAAALLLDEDEVRRREEVAKAMRTLDRFVDPYPSDGGCDEGPSYWGRAGASLFDCLELLHCATAGRIDVYREPLVEEIGRFIYRVQIDGDYFLNFADAPALVQPDAMLVFGYGERIGDTQMTALGAWLADRQGVAKGGGIGKRLASMTRQLRALFSLSRLPAAAAPPLPRDSWLPAIEVLAARDRPGTAQGLFVAAKGGHNDESHNHNDVGSFVLSLDGRPVIVDAGVETYTAKTFSDQRYAIWTMQSAYHSLLPVLDGVQQRAGASFRATEVRCRLEDAVAELALDIAAAYPPEASLARWRRTITLERGKSVRIVDEYALTRPVGEIELGMLTPCAVDPAEPGLLALRERALPAARASGAGRFAFDAGQFAVEVQTLPIEDPALSRVWGDRLFRIVLRARPPAPAGRWEFRFTPA